MKHTFEHGQVPVICNLKKAEELKESIDKQVADTNEATKTKFSKAGTVFIISGVLLLCYFVGVPFCLSKFEIPGEYDWLLAIPLFVLFITFLSTIYGVKEPPIEEAEYPMSVRFFMLNSKEKIFKSVIHYKNKIASTCDIVFYWIDNDDIVQKYEFTDLKIKYKANHSCEETTVDLDEECVYEPFDKHTQI